MLKKLGFGCMRLPLLDKGDQTAVDMETFNALVDTFLEKGFTYFDTALTYHSYHSEEFVRQALVDRHPRWRFEAAACTAQRPTSRPGCKSWDSPSNATKGVTA